MSKGLNKKWPSVPLGNILTERKEKPSLHDILTGKIRIVSKISFDNGQIQLRSDSKTKTGMILIRSGDLVLSGINACKGAVAIYYENSGEPITATIHYSAYIPRKDKVEIKFLWWLLRSEVFRDILNQHLPGGIKTELRAKRFLIIPIPLPPLPEQRRIVAKIEELTPKIEEAKGLRRQAIEEADTVIDSALSRIFNQENKCGIISNIMDSDLEINREYRNPAAVNPDEDFLYLDISNVESKTGRILEAKKIKGYNAPSRARRVIRTNNVLFSTVRPYLRSFTIVPSFLDNQICSTGFAVFSCPKSINPKFLFYHFLSPFFIEQCEAKMRGGHYPAINDTNLKKLKLVIPDITEQNSIVAYLGNLQEKTGNIKRLQLETQSELDALTPSILAKAFRGEL